MSRWLLEVRGLEARFRVGGSLRRRSILKAVDDVSFEIGEGEVLGLVGESGCGKSTIARILTRLERSAGGVAKFDGRDILTLSAAEFRPLRKSIQMIFQDPFASLNPRLSIEKTLSEPLFIHRLVKGRSQARDRVAEFLERVGMDSSAMRRHPHEFSGGQRQRIGIARAMIVEPQLIIADEAVSALDVSIQAQVLNLIRRVQRDSGASMLFISHDLGVVRHISDRVAVMQRGKIVETGDRKRIFDAPHHDYTRLLLAACPRLPVPGHDAATDRGTAPLPMARA